MGESKNKFIGKMALVLLVSVLLAVAMLSGCVDDGKNGKDGKTTLKVNGSSTVYPIAQLCAEAFNQENDDITVEVGSPPVGSGGGINMLGKGEVHIGCASREIKQSERDEHPDVDFYDNVIAYDGVAVIVSSEIYTHATANVTNLTTEQVLGIYNGTITDWGDVGGPAGTEIAVHGREEGSGTRDTFMMAIFGDEDANASGVNFAWSGNSEVQSNVDSSDKAIGYVGLGYVSNDTTPAVILDGVYPKENTIKDQTYPIYRSLHMYTDGEPTGAVKEYIDYIKSTAGQQVVADEGFITLN